MKPSDLRREICILLHKENRPMKPREIGRHFEVPLSMLHRAMCALLQRRYIVPRGLLGYELSETRGYCAVMNYLGGHAFGCVRK